MAKKEKAKKNIFSNKWVSWIFFALIILCLFWWLYYYVTGIDTRGCKSIVKEFLKAPSTAIFYNVHSVSDSLIKWSVESQNWFWAMWMNYFYCEKIWWTYIPTFKDDWTYMYDYFEEIERTWTWDYEKIKVKKMYEWKDILESCEQFAKEYYWDDIKVYATKTQYLDWFWVKWYSVDFHINYNWTRIEWKCSQDDTWELWKDRNWIYWMTINWKTITEFDLKK